MDPYSVVPLFLEWNLAFSGVEDLMKKTGIFKPNERPSRVCQIDQKSLDHEWTDSRNDTNS